ncbi:uclacyanin 1-like [Curcuma longa]|uniref:uclacyanin 1-like n=1 Tax=Curcuma longa TaxID=136217 RepID=UPI003D9E6F70
MAPCKVAFSMMTMAVLVQAASCATYNVGGPNGGWDLSTDLQTWASTQTFVPGDSLVFKYAPFHDVAEVTKAGYDSCSASNAIESYTDGNSVVKLSALGKRFFICGITGHCSGGMKLEIDVVSAAAALTPPAAAAPPSPATSQAPFAPPLLGGEPSTTSFPEPPVGDLGLDLVAPSAPPHHQSAAHGPGLRMFTVVGVVVAFLLAWAL